MTEMKHGVDESFNDRLNILRAAVLGANDGIISIAGVVIGVASATHNIWIIFLSGLSAILAGAFSMAGGEYVSVSTQKDTEEASKPWSKRNTASSMKNLPILGMLLHLASLLFRLVPFLQCSLSFSFQLPIAFR